jgi:hypothetical protein
MANPHKGEVEFSADGLRFTLRFNVGSLVKLEQVAGRGFPSMAAEMAEPEKISMTLVRQFFWAALQHHHPDIDIERAGDLMMTAGGLMGAIDLVGRAMRNSFSDENGGGARRPPRGPGRRKQTGPAC